MKVGIEKRATRLHRKALVLAIGMSITGIAFAQSTTGTITGQVPASAGESVQITGGAGFNRTVPVNSSGRYTITLPVGSYTVSLLKNGSVVDSKKNVAPPVSTSVEVDFSAGGSTSSASAVNAQNLSGITVTANSIPPIDVTSTNQNTVITAEQLKHLPIGRDAGAIALLAPGTQQGSVNLGSGPLRGSLVSFGGSSVVENAYYINGFNTSDPLSNTGGITLPYGSIEQQQTLDSGYGAKYGRSAGGVINQIGKSGTNEFHFGGAVFVRPSYAYGDSGNYYYHNPRSTVAGKQNGDLYTYRNDNSRWDTIYDAYISGPLIKDKLFFFVSAEADKSASTSNQPNTVNKKYFSTYHDPKVYAKLDWNINDSNTLAVTGLINSDQYHSSIYDYDNVARKDGAFSNFDTSYKNAYKIWSAQYTSYITDNITLSVLYGKLKGSYYTNTPQAADFDPNLPSIILGQGGQNPLYTGGQSAITNSNTIATVTSPTHRTTNRNFRVDLDWRLGDHNLSFGIDNVDTHDVGDGSSTTGPGYAWEYAQASDAITAVSGDSPNAPPYVGPTGPFPGGEDGYYVDQYRFNTASSVRVKQRAAYIQDDWQITPNFLLKAGIRDDQFTNYNPAGIAYLRLTKPQWAPRIGFAWDVLGDSSLKVFGNVGRYYIALPAAVALRAAGASLFTRTYYTYTSISPDGIPGNLTPITPTNPVGAVSANGEYGLTKDPRLVTSQNAKAEYQDQFVLGMKQQIGPSYVYGVSATVNRLGRILDDYGDNNTINDRLIASGVNPDSYNYADIPTSVIINPGSPFTINVPLKNGSLTQVRITPDQAGFTGAKRKYAALDVFLQHPWNGVWQGKVEYVFSRNFGTTEGPVISSVGQGGSSQTITQNFDYGQLQTYANGDQANEHKHTLIAYGTYQIAQEWTASANVRISSGSPKSCFGFYGADESNPGLGYGPYYHFCGGVPTPPGSTGFTPWTHTLGLSAEYRPLWADKKLGFQVLVSNVFNEHKQVQAYPYYGSLAKPNPRYGQDQGVESPRYVQLGLTYDW